MVDIGAYPWEFVLQLEDSQGAQEAGRLEAGARGQRVGRGRKVACFSRR